MEFSAADIDFEAGQYLTLRAEIDGRDLRRPYSICAGPGDALRVGVRRVEGGRFSGFVNDDLKVGDVLKVSAPEGAFTPRHAGPRLLVAAGSGITPVLAILKAALARGDAATLVYGNRETGSIMFREELEDLKDRHMGRFSLIHVLSRETQDAAILSGRIDPARLRALTEGGLIDPVNAAECFLCGPGEMMENCAAALQELGAKPDRVRLELFTPADGQTPAPSAAAREVASSGVRIEARLDGVSRSFNLTDSGDSVLSAAAKAGLELPFSCAGGMCCTCRCRIVEGAAEMAVNYSLQPWEIAAGFTLACQARPTTDKLVLDFDAV